MNLDPKGDDAPYCHSRIGSTVTYRVARYLSDDMFPRVGFVDTVAEEMPATSQAGVRN